MELKEVKSLTDIKQGDTIIITGDILKNEAVKAQIVKVTEQDGTEIIFDKKNNRFFNLGMYLEGKSWVKECKVVSLDQNELKKCSISDIDSVLAAVISPLTEKGYQILIQPWVDGWLLHLYVKNGSEHLTTIGAPTLQEAVAKGVLYNGVNTVLVNGFVWAVRYSDTDVPDKHGRWSRLCYYKGKLICLVSKVVRIDLPTYYKVSDFFPSIQLHNPCYSGVELDKDFETIKKEVEQRFTEFLQVVCS